jgi:hypothetical protein
LAAGSALREIACFTFEPVNTSARLSPAIAAQQTLAGSRPLDSDFMDDTPAKENPAKDFNKLDLSQLQGFSFGTQWSQDKTSAPDQRDRSERPRRDASPDRREGGGGAPDRRDRRTFRKPLGEGDQSSVPVSPPPPAAAPTDAPPRREFSGDRGPRRDYQGGPRRDGPGGAERGGQRYGGYGARPEMQERGPYDSPFFAVAFYPEDTSFNALAKTIRSSCRTIELFEIARTVIGKTDRFVVVLARKPSASAEAQDAAVRQPIYLSVPDGLPFESEEAALAHVFSNHLGRFFDLAEVEVEPPKGNFQVINKCGVTGELLGPPNYHRYTQIVQQHFAAKVSRMGFDAFRSRIETIRDPEVVAQWIAKMKKTTRYTWKLSSKPAAPAPTPAPAPASAESAAPAIEAAAVAEVSAQEGTTTPESTPALTFDSFEDARSHLLTNAKDKVVRPIETARFHGKLVETMSAGEIRHAVEGALERQRRFPLDTANALRGRLRREHFTIFKKGSKGVSYVCAVKRKFRVPGQTFADSISSLITFVEAHPMVRASELSTKFLGIELPAAPKASEPALPAGEAPATAETAPSAAKPEPVLSVDQRARLIRMQGDLRWLVTEGYVTEFIDGRLFAPPPMVEARKKEVEAEEHDPENFPETPATDVQSPRVSPVVSPVSGESDERPLTASAADVTPVPVPTAQPVEGETPAPSPAPLRTESSSPAPPV